MSESVFSKQSDVLEQRPSDRRDQGEAFGHNSQHLVWWKPNAEHRHKRLTPTVQHGGGGVLMWAAFAVIASTMTSVYQSILKSNVRPFVWRPKLGLIWFMQQWSQTTNDDEKNHQDVAMVQSKSRSRTKKMLWLELRRAVHKHMHGNINELRQRSKEHIPKSLSNDLRDR